jgi:hypothetical protein
VVPWSSPLRKSPGWIAGALRSTTRVIQMARERGRPSGLCNKFKGTVDRGWLSAGARRHRFVSRVLADKNRQGTGAKLRLAPVA